MDRDVEAKETKEEQEKDLWNLMWKL
jgi:hypothetical protein